jgi:hypothetical protein
MIYNIGIRKRQVRDCEEAAVRRISEGKGRLLLELKAHTFAKYGMNLA